MAEDLSKSPVPVRLAYRYPNGGMVSYSARAIARKGDSVTVVVNEFFDDGITVALHAPFLEGLTNFRVISVSRSIRKPGYFETLLRPAEAVPVGPGNGMPAGDSEGLEPAAGAEQVTRPVPKKLVPETVADAAVALADRLDIEPALRFSEALRGVPVELRPMGLMVAVASVLHCVQALGLVEARSLLASTREGVGRFEPQPIRPAHGKPQGASVLRSQSK